MTLLQTNTARRPRVTGTKIIQFDGTPYAANPAHLHDATAEAAVIGCVLQHPALYYSLADTLQAGDFYLAKHGFVWYAFEKLTARNDPIDLHTVASFLTDEAAEGRFKFVPESLNGTQDGIEHFLADLYSAPSDAANIEAYARRVRDAATKVRLLNTGYEIYNAVMNNPSYTSDALIDEANKLLFEATDQRPRQDSRIVTALNEHMSLVEARMAGAALPCTPTGFASLDDRLGGGLFAGEVSILVGGSGKGKTTWLLTMLRQMALGGFPWALCSLEMQKAGEIAPLLISQESGIPRRAQQRGNLTPKQWTDFVDAAGRISKWDAHIFEERGRFTPLALRRKLRALLSYADVDVVAIDGLWLMKHQDTIRDRRDEVSAIMKDLNDIAKGDLGKPLHLIICHQFNREARGARKPTLELLAESADVERSSQQVFALWRSEQAGLPVTELHVLKDRNGTATGTVSTFLYDWTYARYDEV